VEGAGIPPNISLVQSLSQVVNSILFEFFGKKSYDRFQMSDKRDVELLRALPDGYSASVW